MLGHRFGECRWVDVDRVVGIIGVGIIGVGIIGAGGIRVGGIGVGGIGRPSAAGNSTGEAERRRDGD